jgi:AcrR family transcriptional regulator
MPRGEFDRGPRKARTRAALLDAAARVYARRGFAGATLDDVAEEAGFTKGAIYAHFGSKDELLLALMEEYVAAEIARQVAAFDRSETTWKRPVAGSDQFMAELEETPDVFRLLVEFWVHAQRDERLRERFAAGLGALRETVAGFAAATAADAGLRVSAPASAHVADVFLAMAIGLGMMRLADAEQVRPELLGTALSVFIRALERDPELARAIADPAQREGGSD